jgi:6-phosphogluconolactonase
VVSRKQSNCPDKRPGLPALQYIDQKNLHHQKKTGMKKSRHFMAAALASSFLLFACQKEMKDSYSENINAAIPNGPAAKEQTSVGSVYTLSNEASGNRVLAYSRSAAGTLSFRAAYATGGNGTGSGLGSQGSVILSGDNGFLLAVNAGSHSVSSFKLAGGDLQLLSTVASGGTMPISISEHNNLVYVLNAGGTGNISGFTLDAGGNLHSLANSSRPLSSSGAGPAQISFARNGAVVVVTEKMTNKIISYTIKDDGTPGIMHTLTSANATPFGFAVGTDGILYVSEAAGGAPGASTVSSYQVAGDGAISLIEGPVPAGQTAACWVVLTNNEKFVYATNTGSNTVSSFHASGSGMLNVLEAVAAGMDINVPIDAALSNNSKFLYVLNSGSGSITGMAVNHDGSLGFLQNVGGLPHGDVGLAAK